MFIAPVSSSDMQRARETMPSAGELIPLGGSNVLDRTTPMKGRVAEIAPGVYPISTCHPDHRLQFNQFLIMDDEPLVMQTEFKRVFSTRFEGGDAPMSPAARDHSVCCASSAKLR